MPPKVSVAVPVYNGAAYLAAALESILCQTFSDFEVIVTDNCSTDDTPNICRDFAARDTRVRYVRNGKNLGAAANYNLGLELACGTYLKWAAHDDLVSPNFLDDCVAALDASPTSVLAFGVTKIIDPAGSLLSEEIVQVSPMTGLSPADRFTTFLYTGGTCFPIFGLFRTDALRASTGHRPYYGSDRALLAEMLLMGDFAFVESAVYFNRERPDRSINLEKNARIAWQDTGSAKRHSTEHLSYLRHLFEIAMLHGDRQTRTRLRMRIARWALQPLQIVRYTAEGAGYLAPNSYPAVRRTIRRVIHS